jgi:ubiquinone/menaquinone biosynthesis C-methylase UbiE
MKIKFLPSIFSFGQYERDKWVADKAQSIPKGFAVLDVGAGPCRYKHLFSHCVYKSQDFSQYQGSSLSKLTDDSTTWHYGQIDYISDANSIPVEDDAFDVIICTEVLEHVPEPIKVLQEIGRILRPGGNLILTAPLTSGLHQEPYHFYGGFTPYWYQKYLTQFDFSDIEISPNGGFFKHYGQESQRFSAFIDPRRLNGWMKVFLIPLWLITLPWFRFLLPVMCHYMDALDKHRGFTVGYHVTAIKNVPVQSVKVGNRQVKKVLEKG